MPPDNAQDRMLCVYLYAQQVNEYVFSDDVIVLEALGLFPRKSHDPSGPHSELLKPVPVILIERFKCLNEILFLLTQLLYLIIVILNALLRADRLLFIWLLPALLVVTLAIPLRF